MAKVCFRLYQYMMREQNFAKAQRFAETGFTAATACSGSADATGRLEMTAEFAPSPCSVPSVPHPKLAWQRTSEGFTYHPSPKPTLSRIPAAQR